MNKLRNLVIFEIEDTSFEVDIDKQVLRQTNDQTNEISFIRDMQDQLTFLVVLTGFTWFQKTQKPRLNAIQALFNLRKTALKQLITRRS